MEIRIREIPDKILRLTFAPDSQRWFRQNPPAEYCLAKIGGVSAFVKRQANEFTGWKLLVNAISHSQITNTPRIISIARHENYHYYFSERLDGMTLEEDLKQSNPFFHAPSSSARLIDALEDINKRGYWFSDLCKKNIFVCKNGESHLIDLDSCFPHGKKFDPGLRVAFDYKTLISEFLTQKPTASQLDLRQLSGECINQAEVVSLAVDISTKFKIRAEKREKVAHGILLQPKTEKLYLKLFKSLASNKADWALTRELVRAID